MYTIRKLDAATQSKIVALYKQGRSMQSLAEEFGVSSATIHRYVKSEVSKAERQSRKNRSGRGRKKLSKGNIEEIEQLYLQGKSSVELARQFNCTPNTIIYHLCNANIDTSRRGKYAPKVDDEMLKEIVKTYRKTKSILKTAKRFDLHPSSVQARLRKLGVVKKGRLNHDMVKKKYRLMTDLVVALFEKLGYGIKYIQERYNGPGPDALLVKDKSLVVLEHKATVKRSYYWQHGLEEAKRGIKNHDAAYAYVVTTASKPRAAVTEPNVKFLFYEDIKDLLHKHKLTSYLPDLDFISNTPCV